MWDTRQLGCIFKILDDKSCLYLLEQCDGAEHLFKLVIVHTDAITINIYKLTLLLHFQNNECTFKINM